MEQHFHLGIKALFLNEQKQFLLCQAIRRNGQGTYWDLPGGRVQEGEDVLCALKREVAEELNLKEFSIGPLLSTHLTPLTIRTPQQEVGLVLQVYLCYIHPDVPLCCGSELTDYSWLGESEATPLLGTTYPPNLCHLALEKFIPELQTKTTRDLLGSQLV